jgi:hypothetical protein
VLFAPKNSKLELEVFFIVVDDDGDDDQRPVDL